MAKVGLDVLIIVIVNDIIFVLSDNIHGTEDVERVIHSSLHVLEIDFLPYVDEVLIHLKNLVSDLCTGDHRPLSHFL